MARGPLAGAAGPGKFSVRTDGLSMPSAAYGEGVDTAAIKAGAPLAKTPNVRGATATDVRQAAQSAGPITPLYAPSERPGEPVTAGIAMGAGPGPEVLGMSVNQDTEEDRNRLISYLPALEAAAADPNSSQAFRNYVRLVRANLR
jgi:hypothetical protein